MTRYYLLSLLAALFLLAAFQTTGSAQTATETDQQAGAIVSEFRYANEGSFGRLVVNGTSVTYYDEYCGGMTNSTGVLKGTKIKFDRMTYPDCGKPEALWADIVVKGFDPATGCFKKLKFTWGYDFIKKYYAYPTDPKC